MGNNKAAERKVRKEIIAGLPVQWQAVTAGGGDCSILTAPNGDFGTVNVVILAPKVVRIVLNDNQTRRRGSHEFVLPALRPRVEVTLAEDELPLYVKWCADWLAAATESPPSSAPTALDINTHTRVYTVAAAKLRP